MHPSGRTLRAVQGTGRPRCYGCLPYPRQEAFPCLASNRFPGLRGPYTDMKSALGSSDGVQETCLLPYAQTYAIHEGNAKAAASVFPRDYAKWEWDTRSLAFSITKQSSSWRASVQT
jgi:hypothetical protein